MSRISAVQPGTALSRYVKCLCLANGSDTVAGEIASKYLDTPEVRLTFEKKSVSEPTDTSSTLGTFGIAQSFLELSRGVSAVDHGKSRASVVPFRTKFPVEQTSPAGDFVGETGAIPVRAAAFDSISGLELLKIANICVLTKELVRSASPDADVSIRRMLINAAAYTLDKKFLDPTSVAISGVRPASITAAGASTVASTGSTAALIQADLGSMAAALTSWRDPVWILRLSTLTAIQARNPQLVTYAGGVPFILGLPVFTSLGSPQQITLVDIASIVVADQGVELAASSEATVEMDDQPVQGELSPVTDISTLKSFFQNGLYGVRIIREINWARSLASGVVVMATSY